MALERGCPLPLFEPSSPQAVTPKKDPILPMLGLDPKDAKNDAVCEPGVAQAPDAKQSATKTSLVVVQPMNMRTCL